jgi:3-oxoacyl-[acyl-carrier-protein] synthase-3
MAVGRVDGIVLAGIYAGVPGQIVENASLTDLASAADLQKVIKNIGIERRRVAPIGQCTSDLAYAAARQLLADLGWAPDTIGLLIFVSQTGDHPLPATACLLQERLGLPKSCAAFDINLGCSGYVYGLWIASQLMKSLGGTRALLLVGDTITHTTAPNDKSVRFLFGDAATASALENRPGAPAMTFVLGTDGTGAPHLIIPAGGAGNRTDAGSQKPGAANESGRSPANLFMDGPQVFNFTLREVPALLSETLDAAGWSQESVDHFVLHQANGYLLDYLAKRTKLPKDRMVVALQDFGNTSSASIPLAISAKLGEALRDRPARLLLAGFGVGWSWGGAAIETSAGLLSKIIDVEMASQGT